MLSTRQTEKFLFNCRLGPEHLLDRKLEECWNENPPGISTEQLWTCFIGANQYITNAISDNVLKMADHIEHTKAELPTNIEIVQGSLMGHCVIKALV